MKFILTKSQQRYKKLKNIAKYFVSLKNVLTFAVPNVKNNVTET